MYTSKAALELGCERVTTSVTEVTDGTRRGGKGVTVDSEGGAGLQIQVLRIGTLTIREIKTSIVLDQTAPNMAAKPWKP